MNLTITNTSEGVWTFSWDADSGVSYEVWLNGVLLATVDEGEYECSYPGYSDTPPPLEIVEENTAESEIYPPFLQLQWRRVAGAAAYKVEEYVDAAWVTRRTIIDTGAEYYLYQTPVLLDGTEAIWRVSALDTTGDAGTAVSFTMEMCCNPAEPAVEMDYDSNGDLVLSEA